MNGINIKTYDSLKGRNLRDFVYAGFNARRGDDERKYLFLLNELSDFSQNPYFRHTIPTFVIAYKNGVPVGRVAVTYDGSYNEYHEKYGRSPVVWFGWLDFDDDKTGEKLLNTALEIANKYKENLNSDVSAIIGPGNPNENGVVGLRKEGNFVFFMEPDQPIRYNEVFGDWKIDENGKGIWMSAKLDNDDIDRWSKVISKSSDFELRGYDIKKYGKLNVNEAFNSIKEIYNIAWDSAAHPHGRMLYDDEFKNIFSGLKMILPFGWNEVYVAYKGNEPVAVSVALPNFNEVFSKDADSPKAKMAKELLGLLHVQFKQSYNGARIFISGSTLHNHDGKLLVAKMTSETLKNLRSRGVNEITMSQLSVENTDVINPVLGLIGVEKGGDIPHIPDKISRAVVYRHEI